MRLLYIVTALNMLLHFYSTTLWSASNSNVVYMHVRPEKYKVLCLVKTLKTED